MTIRRIAVISPNSLRSRFQFFGVALMILLTGVDRDVPFKGGGFFRMPGETFGDAIMAFTLAVAYAVRGRIFIALDANGRMVDSGDHLRERI